jgi:Phosphotransferase enzyme family
MPDAARQLDLLTGSSVGDFLGAAVAAVDGRLVRWRTRDVAHTATRGSTACYDTKVRWADGRVTAEIFAACTGDLPDGAVVLDDGLDQVAVWRFPNDPELPGLAAAHNAGAVARLLGDLGKGVGPVRLQVRTYRPRRRAVIEVVGPGGHVFLKVVRPSRVESLHLRHRLLVDHGVPAPQSLGWTPDGLLVLQALHGQTLRDALRSRATPLPPGGAISDLLDGLPRELAEHGAGQSWLDRVRGYAAVVATIVPEQAERITRIGDDITAESRTGPIVPVHGDFYERQLLVQNGRVCGLLDVDGARPGDRFEDVGSFLGHLSVLAHTERSGAAAINRVGAGYLAEFERRLDAADLRYRIAAVVVSLATGPHRIQQPGWRATTCRLIELADNWLASARSAADRRLLDETPLTAGS